MGQFLTMVLLVKHASSVSLRLAQHFYGPLFIQKFHLHGQVRHTRVPILKRMHTVAYFCSTGWSFLR
jgi:hypothetical protein